MIDLAAFDALEGKDRPRRKVGKARAGAPPERIVQREIVKAARQLGFIVHHSPNGTTLSGDSLARQKQSAVLVADGMMPGWLDLTMFNRSGDPGMMEVKREGGIISADQERVLALLARWHVKTAVVCTLDEAYTTWRRWGWL
jgi:hypothetical protein